MIVKADSTAFPLPDRSVDLVFGSPPYEDARLPSGKLRGEAWVEWMKPIVRESLRVSKGMACFVVCGRQVNHDYSATPELLLADLKREGMHIYRPCIYHRSGIPGSGGKHWLRNDYEPVLCFKHPGTLPWSDNLACGAPPKYERGGNFSNRTRKGDRVAGQEYPQLKLTNPGNVFHGPVGGGHMGHDLAHENEAPFPEWLVERFVRSFCPPGGIVLDPFSGSGTTAAVAFKHDRNFIAVDNRETQCALTRRRLEDIGWRDSPPEVLELIQSGGTN